MANIGHRSTQRVMEILELIAFSGVEDGFSLTQQFLNALKAVFLPFYTRLQPEVIFPMTRRK